MLLSLYNSNITETKSEIPRIDTVPNGVKTV